MSKNPLLSDHIKIFFVSGQKNFITLPCDIPQPLNPEPRGADGSSIHLITGVQYSPVKEPNREPSLRSQQGNHVTRLPCSPPGTSASPAVSPHPHPSCSHTHHALPPDGCWRPSPCHSHRVASARINTPMS